MADPTMNIGTNERDHPNSSPLQSPSPRTHSPLGGGNLRQDSLDLKLSTSPSHSPVPSPQHHLDRPIDDRLHNRRPSDEATQILRKSSSAGMQPQYNYLPVNHPDYYKTNSLPPMSQMRYGPSESLSYQNFNDLARMQQQFPMFGLGDPGRIHLALSDGYLNSIGQDFSANAQDFDTFPDFINRRGILSPEDSLAPPLSNQDRHPSAPQLASILTSSVDKPDIVPMAEDAQDLPLRKRSWSMPSNAPLFLAPQINVCSPDDPLNQMNQTASMCKFN